MVLLEAVLLVPVGSVSELEMFFPAISTETWALSLVSSNGPARMSVCSLKIQRRIYNDDIRNRDTHMQQW